jgi:hypothetical protein
VRPVRGGSIGLGPELDKAGDLPLRDREKEMALAPALRRSLSSRLLPTRPRDEAIDRELPSAVCGIPVHAREAFGAANAFFELRPFEDKVGARTAATESKSLKWPSGARTRA